MKVSEIKAMSERIAVKARVCNICVRNGVTNRKPFDELRGMLAILTVLNVEYDFVYDYSSTYMTGFKIPAYGIDIIL